MHLKNIFIALLVFTIGLSAYSYVSQNDIQPEIAVGSDNDQTYFYIINRGEKSVSSEALKNSKTVADFVKDYPASGMAGYETVEIHTTSSGRQQKAISIDEKLTSEQKEILATADLFTDVVVYMKRKSSNSAADIDFSAKLLVRPEVEASFPGEKEALISYLRDNSKAELAKISTQMGISAIVYFTIDENGNPMDIKISEAATHKGADAFLIKALENMPKWSPAKDANGNAVKQKFEFVFGFSAEEGGGC